MEEVSVPTLAGGPEEDKRDEAPLSGEIVEEATVRDEEEGTPTAEEEKDLGKEKAAPNKAVCDARVGEDTQTSPGLGGPGGNPSTQTNPDNKPESGKDPNPSVNVDVPVQDMEKSTSQHHGEKDLSASGEGAVAESTPARTETGDDLPGQVGAA